MRRTLVIAVLLAAIAAGMAAAPGVARSAVTLTKSEKAIIAAVNRERAERGLGALRVNAALTIAARAHSRDMAHGCYFSHFGRDGDSAGDRVRQSGYSRTGCSSWAIGEALARASLNRGSDCERIVAAWMLSRCHRRILLASAFRDAGVGIRSAGGRRYFTLDVGCRTR